MNPDGMSIRHTHVHYTSGRSERRSLKTYTRGGVRKSTNVTTAVYTCQGFSVYVKSFEYMEFMHTSVRS